MYSLKDTVKRLRFKIFGYPEVIVDNSLSLELDELKRRIKVLEQVIDEILPQALKTIPEVERTYETVSPEVYDKLRGYKTLSQRVREFEKESYQKVHAK